MPGRRLMMTDYDAPISERYEIEIFAPPEKVWDWLSRVDLWKSWRQDVTYAAWESGYGAGGTLKWRVRKLMGFTAYVETWSESREMRLRSSALMTQVFHSMQISGDIKKTRVTVRVSASGGLTRFRPTKAMLRGQLNRTNEILLGALKTKLEAGKDDSMDPPPGLDDPFSNNVRLPSQRHDLRG